MRPAIIRLIAGGALGIAFSVSLMLPGALVFPEDEPVRHFASPRVPAATVVRAAPNVLRTQKAPAPAPQPVVVRKVSVPAARPVPAARVVGHIPARSTPSPRPRKRRPTPPAEQRLTPLAATPSQPTSAKKPKKAKKTKKDGPLSGETKTKKPKKDEPRSGEKKTKKEKGRDEGDYEGGEQERGDDEGEGRDDQRKGGDDEGGDRGDYGIEG